MLSGDVAITADGASLPPHATERKNGTTAPLPVFVRLFRVTFQPPDRYVNDPTERSPSIPAHKPLINKISVHRVIAVRVPATSTDARIHVTRDD